MSKKIVEGECAYCGEVGEITRDHVIPRCLFTTLPTSGLVIVSACKKCNGEKSKNDDFLRDVLATDIFAENSELAKNIMGTKFLRSAMRNSSDVAKTILNSSSIQPFYSRGGIYLGEAVSAPLDQLRFEKTIFTICKGLFYDAKKVRIPDDYKIQLLRYQPKEFQQVCEQFAEKLKLHEPKKIGDVFWGTYVSVQEDIYSSIWLLQFYGIIGFSVSILRPDFEAESQRRMKGVERKRWGSK